MGYFWGLSKFLVAFAIINFSAQAIAEPPKHRRAIIIGLDGTTGSQFHYRTLVQHQAPNFEKIMADAKYTPCIAEKHPATGGFLDPRCARAHSGHRTGPEFKWLTGPGWCSVLTGVNNNKHAVTDNTPASLSTFSTTSHDHPTIMKQLISNGLKTAAGGVSAFMTSNNGGTVVPGIIDYECGAAKNHRPLLPASATTSCNLTARQAQDESKAARDENLTKFLAAQIADPNIDLVMGVYDTIDSAGHHSGFSSNKHYLETITQVDTMVGKLIAGIETGVRDRQEEWLVIVTADHGGHMIAAWGIHDTRDKEDDSIPFIVRTYGSSQQLHQLRYPVSHMDVHPTLMEWFGLPPTVGIDGHIQAL